MYDVAFNEFFAAGFHCGTPLVKALVFVESHFCQGYVFFLFCATLGLFRMRGSEDDDTATIASEGAETVEPDEQDLALFMFIEIEEQLRVVPIPPYNSVNAPAAKS